MEYNNSMEFVERRREQTRHHGRVIYLCGMIEEQVSQEINIELIRLQREDPLQDITMIIDSFGGDLFATFSIVDMMEMITCDIQTICIGKAMSAGQFLFSSGTKGKRFMTKHARLMLHNPIAGMEGSVPDIEIEIEELQRNRDLFVKQISKNCKLSETEVLTLIGRNAYLDATQSIEMGFADGLIKRLK